MAIQMRRGAYADLDKSKLVAGEIVVSTSGTQYVGIAKAPSDVIKLATQDDLDNVIALAGAVRVEDGCITFGREE